MRGGQREKTRQPSAPISPRLPLPPPKVWFATTMVMRAGTGRDKMPLGVSRNFSLASLRAGKAPASPNPCPPTLHQAQLLSSFHLPSER